MHPKYRAWRFASAASFLAAALWIAACGSGTVVESGNPPGHVDTTTTTPTVSRGSIAVTVGFDDNDRALATRAGIATTSLEVVLQSLSRPAANVSAPVDADGRARFDSLLEGRYSLSVHRVLTTEEIDRLSASEQWATLFAGGREVVLSPPNMASAQITLLAPRRGSLVISEIFPYRPGPPIFYAYGTYLELFNNSDSTIYLDGMVLFRTNPQLHTTVWGPCSQNEQLRADSTAVWARLLWTFPGTGKDFSIASGRARVIAMDAMNHASASPQTAQVDLAGADFEQFGTEADIDNPFVPNLENLRAGAGAFGRGWPLESEVSYGVSLPLGSTPLDSSSALRRQSDGLTTTLYRVPRSRVLDVVSFNYTPEVLASLAQRGSTVTSCDPWLGKSFDQSPAYLVDFVDVRAIARRSLGRTSDGREILQRTQASARDFEYAAPLRRSLRR